MSVILVDGCPDPLAEASYRRWETLVELLTTADVLRERGALSPVEYEALWWQAYEGV